MFVPDKLALAKPSGDALRCAAPVHRKSLRLKAGSVEGLGFTAYRVELQGIDHVSDANREYPLVTRLIDSEAIFRECNQTVFLGQALNYYSEHRTHYSVANFSALDAQQRKDSWLAPSGGFNMLRQRFVQHGKYVLNEISRLVDSQSADNADTIVQGHRFVGQCFIRALMCEFEHFRVMKTVCNSKALECFTGLTEEFGVMVESGYVLEACPAMVNCMFDALGGHVTSGLRDATDGRGCVAKCDASEVRWWCMFAPLSAFCAPFIFVDARVGLIKPLNPRIIKDDFSPISCDKEIPFFQGVGRFLFVPRGSQVVLALDPARSCMVIMQHPGAHLTMVIHLDHNLDIVRVLEKCLDLLKMRAEATSEMQKLRQTVKSAAVRIDELRSKLYNTDSDDEKVVMTECLELCIRDQKVCEDMIALKVGLHIVGLNSLKDNEPFAVQALAAIGQLSVGGTVPKEFRESVGERPQEFLGQVQQGMALEQFFESRCGDVCLHGGSWFASPAKAKDLDGLAESDCDKLISESLGKCYLLDCASSSLRLRDFIPKPSCFKSRSLLNCSIAGALSLLNSPESTPLCYEVLYSNLEQGGEPVFVGGSQLRFLKSVFNCAENTLDGIYGMIGTVFAAGGNVIENRRRAVAILCLLEQCKQDLRRLLYSVMAHFGELECQDLTMRSQWTSEILAALEASDLWVGAGAAALHQPLTTMVSDVVDALRYGESVDMQATVQKIATAVVSQATSLDQALLDAQEAYNRVVQEGLAAVSRQDAPVVSSDHQMPGQASGGVVESQEFLGPVRGAASSEPALIDDAGVKAGGEPLGGEPLDNDAGKVSDPIDGVQRAAAAQGDEGVKPTKKKKKKKKKNKNKKALDSGVTGVVAGDDSRIWKDAVSLLAMASQRATVDGLADAPVSSFLCGDSAAATDEPVSSVLCGDSAAATDGLARRIERGEADLRGESCLEDKHAVSLLETASQRTTVDGSADEPVSSVLCGDSAAAADGSARRIERSEAALQGEPCLEDKLAKVLSRPKSKIAKLWEESSDSSSASSLSGRDRGLDRVREVLMASSANPQRVVDASRASSPSSVCSVDSDFSVCSVDSDSSVYSVDSDFDDVKTAIQPEPTQPPLSPQPREKAAAEVPDIFARLYPAGATSHDASKADASAAVDKGRYSVSTTRCGAKGYTQSGVGTAKATQPKRPGSAEGKVDVDTGGVSAKPKGQRRRHQRQVHCSASKPSTVVSQGPDSPDGSGAVGERDSQPKGFRAAALKDGRILRGSRRYKDGSLSVQPVIGLSEHERGVGGE